jgi:hypothetical protein
MEGAVAAAPDVREGGDGVAGGDDLADGLRGPRGRLHHAAGVDGQAADVRVAGGRGRRRGARRRRLDGVEPRLETAEVGGDRPVAIAGSGPGGHLGHLLAQEGGAQRRLLVALVENLVGQRPVARLQDGEAVGLPGHLGPRGPRDPHDVRVLMGDPLHERHLVQQVVEAVGVEDDRRQVRLGALIGGHQVGGQCLGGQVEPVLERHQVVAGGQQ